MRNRIWLAALGLFCTSAVALELPDAPPRMPRDVADLRGTYEGPRHPGFSPFNDLGGAMVFDHIAISYYSNGIDAVVMTKWQLPSGDGPATWLITDAVEAGRIGDNQTLYMDCMHREKNIFISTFAVGDMVDGDRATSLDRVWDVSSRDGTITEVSPRGVTCVNEGGD